MRGSNFDGGNFFRVNSVLVSMRSKGALIQIVVALVLALAQVPSSALAGMFLKHSDCDMPCCRTQVSPIDSSVQSCHIEATPGPEPCGSHTASANGSFSAKKSSCDCSISAPSENRGSPVAIASTSSQSSFLPFAALLPPELISLAPQLSSLRQPGIRGTDSGPPAQRSHSVWLGRAPPVLLA